jgi:hypothetical protein
MSVIKVGPGGARSSISLKIRLKTTSPNPRRWCSGNTTMSTTWKTQPPLMARPMPTTAGVASGADGSENRMWHPNQVCWMDVAIWDLVIWRTAATLRRWWKSLTGAQVSISLYPGGRGGTVVFGASILLFKKKRCVVAYGRRQTRRVDVGSKGLIRRNALPRHVVLNTY